MLAAFFIHGEGNAFSVQASCCGQAIYQADRGRFAIRAAIEALETRQLLTTVVVNSLLDNVNDSNIGGSSVTLREAVNYENANGGGTITFAPALAGDTLNLSTIGDNTFGPSDFGISTNITIDGPTGSNGITLDNSGTQRLFYISSTGSLTLSDLTLDRSRAARISAAVPGTA